MSLIYAVEDDIGIGELYSYAFESAGYDYAVFTSGKSFFVALEKNKPDLLLLDIMLPDTDGYSIIKKLRRDGYNFPVIMVTAKGDELSTIKGLDNGADDYVIKPFSVLELIARIKARLRNIKSENKNIVCGDLVIDTEKYEVTWKDEKLYLSVKEYEIIKLLASRREKVFSRDEILNIVWGVDFMGESRALDMHIRNLREKLDAVGAKDFILTVRGVGYKIAEQKGAYK